MRGSKRQLTPEEEVKELGEYIETTGKYWREVSEGIAELNARNAWLPCAMGSKVRRKRK